MKNTFLIKDFVHDLMINYSHIIASSNIKIKEYKQGYMNYVLNISTKKGQIFTGVLFNYNRYNGDFAKKMLENINICANYLTRFNIPVRKALLNKSGKTISIINLNQKQRFFTLYKYLEGNTISWEAYTRRHLRSMGQTLALIHNKWTNFNGNISYIPKWEEYFNIDSINLMNYFDTNYIHIAKKLGIKLNADYIKLLINNIKKISKSSKLKKQLIHCDFVRGNILFDNIKYKNIYKITGVLDFEKTLIGPIEFDICRTIAFLLVDCKYKSYKEIFYYFLQDGYFKGKNISINPETFQYLIRYFITRDLWKFLQCNPYENLYLNYHFNKTVKLLKNLNLLEI